MHFITALIALAGCYGCWKYFWSTTDFKAYVASLHEQGSRAIYVFWASVAFAAWGLLINDSAPASLSLLVSIVTAVAWLVSPAGEKFLKEMFR